MATKVKPTRLNISGTIQQGQVPIYVNDDCFGVGTIPTDNCQLANSCGYLQSCDLACYAQCCDIPDVSGYQKVCNMVCDLTGADNNHYPSAKAVADALSCAGAGDMLKSVYDPNNHNADAFDYCNFTNTPTIPTDNCQLANGCGYATCCYVNDSINSVTAYYITKNAQGDQFATYAELAAATTFYSGGQVRVPTRNDYTIVLADENHDNATTRYIYNSGWEYQYTVNETALTQAQLDAINSGINCSKVNYYDCCLAQCCDIPTDNCQLSNGCGYTTCTGTLVPSDIACINGCCLTNGGNVCLDGLPSQTGCCGKFLSTNGTSASWEDVPAGGIQNDTTGTTDTIDCIWSGTKAEFDLITKDPDNYYIVKDAGSPEYIVCDAAFSCDWDGVTDKAPSMNAVYDVLGDVETLLANL